MVSIIDLVETYWADQAKKERTGHYPSELESCRRQLYYKWTGAPPSDPIEPTGYWRMEMGDAIHALIQQVLSQVSGLNFRAEVPWSITWPGLMYPIRGRVDGLYRDPETGEQVVLEIKTTYGRGVRAIKEEGARRYLPQVALYLRALDIRTAHLVIIGRDDADRCELVVEQDPDGVHLSRVYGPDSWETGERYNWSELDALLERLKSLEEAVSWRELPAREYNHLVVDGQLVDEVYDKVTKTKVKSDWQCRYCQWRKKCWLEDKDK